MKLGLIGYVSAVILVLTGLNMGVVALFDYNIAQAILGTGVAERIAEGVVGLAGLGVGYDLLMTGDATEAEMAHA